MAFISLPYGIKVEIAFTKDGQICLNVMWCAKLSPITVNSTDLDNVLSAVGTLWSGLRSDAASNVFLSSIKATDWSVADGIQAENLAPATPSGLSSTGFLDNSVTIAVALKSAQRGRSRNGRFFIVGMTGNQLASPNVLNAGTAADIIAAYQAYKTALNGFGLAPVIASFVTGGAPRAVGLGTAVASVGFTDGTLDSQRRRLPGRGT